MIQLEQIPLSDKLGNLRKRINTMVNEINTNQMVVGQVMNPSITFLNEGKQVGAIAASNLSGTELYALCMPESNGVYISQVFGVLRSSYSTPGVCTETPASIAVDIPAVKLPNRDAVVSTFVTPEDLSFTTVNEGLVKLPKIVVMESVYFKVGSSINLFDSNTNDMGIKSESNHAELQFYTAPR